MQKLLVPDITARKAGNSCPKHVGLLHLQTGCCLLTVSTVSGTCTQLAAPTPFTLLTSVQGREGTSNGRLKGNVHKYKYQSFPSNCKLLCTTNCAGVQHMCRRRTWQPKTVSTCHTCSHASAQDRESNPSSNLEAGSPPNPPKPWS